MRKNIDDSECLISRVCRMENYFDLVKNALENDKTILYNDFEIKEMIQILNLYQKSGQWLKDFECDEREELPLELKRGVLSEDGLYNLLMEVEIELLI